MNPHLNLKVVWQDDDLVELEATATNEDFSGRTCFYTTYEEISRVGCELQRFPRSLGEQVAFESGAPGDHSFFRARFYCFHATGHAAVRVELQSNVATEHRPEEENTLGIEIQFEPAACSPFADALLAMVENSGGRASLAGIPKYTQNILKET